MTDRAAAASNVPFVGLRPFDTGDERWFFGRDRETAILARKVRESQFTAVVGPSGSGKSSIVRAGVVPQLEKDGWTVIIAKPGSAPIARLARALALSHASGSAEPDAPVEAWQFRFGSILRASAYGLVKIAETLRSHASQILLVVDQFEELFRYGQEAAGTARAAMREEGRAFVELLLRAAAQSDSGLSVCVTMRSDFFGNCSAYVGLAEAVSASQFLVPLPRRDQLEEAIRKPVALAGAAIETGVVQRLLVDAEEETDQLPLLEHTLRRLWDKSTGNPRLIREDDYVTVGKIAGSIEMKAEAILATLQTENAVDVITLTLVMKALTDLDERNRATRRPQLRSELLALLADTPGVGPGNAEASLSRVLSALSAEDASFLQIGEDKDPEVDISHEAFMRGWTKLAGPNRNFTAGWLYEEREDSERWRGYLRTAHESHLSSTEQRRLRRWLAGHRVSDVWSRRYGGGWDEVEELRQRSRRRSIWIAAAAAAGFAIVASATAYPLVGRYQERLLQRDRLAATMLAGQARAKVAAGDTRVAALLAYKALPAGTRTDDERYVAGAEAALFDALARPIETRRIVNFDIVSASFSPDGKRIVSASGYNTVRIWDVDTGVQIRELVGQTGVVNSASFSPDGKRIVSASGDRTVRIWDAGAGIQIGQPLVGHTNSVNSASFSPDGKRIVSASSDKTVRIWDADTGVQIGQPLAGHTAAVNSASFSPDGKRVVSASSDKTVRIWDADTGVQFGQPLWGHTDSVNSASFSPDGKRIVSASSDDTVRLWDADKGQEVGSPMQGHTYEVRTAAFSPDGERIVSASLDHTMRIWDVATGKIAGAPLVGHADAVRDATFSPDGKRIVSASSDGTIRIWEIGAGQPVGPPLREQSGLEHSNREREMVFIGSFSRDGRRIVSASADETLRVWDAGTGRPIGEPLTGHTGKVYDASFSPDGRLIVSASEDKTLRLWDAITGKPIGKPLIGHSDYVECASFSPDGKRIVSASKDKTLRLWDTSTGLPIGKPFLGHTGAVESAQFSPDGSRIVSASSDGTLRLWDAKTGAPIGSLGGHTDEVISVTFTPDGKRIVSASEDRSLRLWDAGNGKQIGAPWLGHTDRVWGVSISPDGRRAVSASADRTLRFWDITTGQQLGAPLVGHGDLVRGVSFSPDGRRVLSASFDGTLRLWEAPSSDLAAALRKVEELCPLSDAEMETIGLRDPKFPEPAATLTAAQKQACGL